MIILLALLMFVVFFMCFLASGFGSLIISIVLGDKTCLEEDIRETGMCSDKLPPPPKRKFIPVEKNRDYTMTEDFPPIHKPVIPWKSVPLDDD